MARKLSNASRLSQDEAECFAIEALTFIASDESRFARFLAVTGYDPAAIRAEVGSPDFLAGVLDFLLSDESQLLVFAGHRGIDPSLVGAAKHVLMRDLKNLD